MSQSRCSANKKRLRFGCSKPCLPLDNLEQPDVEREQEDAEGCGADQSVVSMDEDGDVEHVHDVLVDSLLKRRIQTWMLLVSIRFFFVCGYPRQVLEDFGKDGITVCPGRPANGFTVTEPSGCSTVIV